MTSAYHLANLYSIRAQLMIPTDSYPLVDLSPSFFTQKDHRTGQRSTLYPGTKIIDVPLRRGMGVNDGGTGPRIGGEESYFEIR